jgi:hypothetical protein
VRLVPGSGPVTITTRAEDVNAGTWLVGARLESRGGRARMLGPAALPVRPWARRSLPRKGNPVTPGAGVRVTTRAAAFAAAPGIAPAPGWPSRASSRARRCTVPTPPGLPCWRWPRWRCPGGCGRCPVHPRPGRRPRGLGELRLRRVLWRRLLLLRPRAGRSDDLVRPGRLARRRGRARPGLRVRDGIPAAGHGPGLGQAPPRGATDRAPPSRSDEYRRAHPGDQHRQRRGRGRVRGDGRVHHLPGQRRPDDQRPRLPGRDRPRRGGKRGAGHGSSSPGGSPPRQPPPG